MDLEKAQEHITLLNKAVNDYRKGNHNGNDLIELGKEISTLLYYLSTVRSYLHNAFQVEVHRIMKEEGLSAAASNNRTHVKYPMMYQLRHLMTSANDVLGMIRSNLSYLKSEMNNNLN